MKKRIMNLEILPASQPGGGITSSLDVCRLDVDGVDLRDMFSTIDIHIEGGEVASATLTLRRSCLNLIAPSVRALAEVLISEEPAP